MVLSTSVQSSSRSSGGELPGSGVGERVRSIVYQLLSSPPGALSRDRVEDERRSSAVSDVRARVSDAADIDLGWLPEPGRTQALSGRAAAYDDTGRCCAYHLPPCGCALVDGDADGPGLTELCGLTPAKPATVPPETRPGAVTQLLGARLRSTPTGADAATEVRKRSANLMT